MGIFPDFAEALEDEGLEIDNTDKSGELLLFKEYVVDVENNTFKYVNGMPLIVSGDEALKIWIIKCLKTERYKYMAYSDDYGSEVFSLIGYTVNDEIVYLELKRFIIEALMENEYIEELSNFRFKSDGSNVIVKFECITVYGEFEVAFDWGED